MTKSLEYPGYTGVLGIGDTPRLTAAETIRLFEEVQDIIADARDPRAFKDFIVLMAHWFRDAVKLDNDRKPAVRKVDIDRARKKYRDQPDAALSLSQINDYDLRLIRSTRPDWAIPEALNLMDARLPKPRRGRPPETATLHTALLLAQTICETHSQTPTASKEGHFCRLLAAIRRAADGKEYSDVHTVAERALGIAPIEISPGLSVIP
jgi:hypothetical protein